MYERERGRERGERERIREEECERRPVCKRQHVCRCVCVCVYERDDSEYVKEREVDYSTHILSKMGIRNVSTVL